MSNIDYFEALANEVAANTELSSQQATQSLAMNSFLQPSFNDLALEERERKKAEESMAPSVGERIADRATSAAVENVVGGILKTPAQLFTLTEGYVPEDIRAAYAREKEGKATPEDLALLEQDAEQSRGLSYRRHLDQISAAEDLIKGIDRATDMSQELDTTKTDKLQQDLLRTGKDVAVNWELGKKELAEGNTWEGIERITDSVATAIFQGGKDIATNPIAIVEHLAEEVPELGAMLISPAIGVATSGSESLDVRAEAIKELEEEKGRPLTDTELDKVNGLTAAHFGLDYAADLVGLDRLTSMSKKLEKGEAVKAKDAILNNFGTAVSEGASEVGQTAIESEMKDEEAKFEELYAAGATGAAVGSALSSTADAPIIAKDTIKAGAKVTKQGVTKATETIGSKLKKDTQLKDELDEAVKTGDVATATKIMKQMREGKSTPNVAIKAAAKVVSTPEATPAIKQAVSKEVNTEIGKEKTKLANIELGMEMAQEEGDTAMLASLKTEHAKQTKLVQDLEKNAKVVSNAVTLSPEELEVDLANVSNGDEEAATRIQTSFKANPQSVSDKQLESLASNTSLPSQMQKEYKAALEVRKMMNSFEGTNKEVIQGGFNKQFDRHMYGLEEYTNMVIQGNPDGLTGLKKFADRHAKKAASLEAAYEQFQHGDGSDVKVGNLVINAKSANLIKQTRKEADVLNNAYSELVTGFEEVSPEPEVSSESVTTEPETSSVSSTDSSSTSEPVETSSEVDDAPFDDESIDKAKEFQTSVEEATKSNDRDKAINSLRKSYAESPDSLRVVDTILQHANPDVRIVAVRDTSDLSQVPEEDVEVVKNLLKEYPNAMGINNEPNNTIYLFNAGVRPETMMHELDHSALVPALQKAKESPKGSKELEAYRNLVNLHGFLVQRLKKDKEFAAKAKAVYLDRILTEYKPGTNIDYKLNELITWGRTNEGVRELLKTVKIETQKKSIFNSMMEWVADILGISPEDVSVYTQLTTTADIFVGNTKLKPSTVKQLVQDTKPVVQPITQIKDYSLADTLTSQEIGEGDILDRNLFAEYFQKGNGNKSLDSMNDFIGQLKTNTLDTLNQFYEEVTPEVMAATENFLAFHDKFIETLDKEFTTLKPAGKAQKTWRINDYTQYLLQDGELPANVKTAMAVAAFDWVVASAYDSNNKTRDSIKSLLRLKDYDNLPPQVFKMMHGGPTNKSMINSLGSSASATLNFALTGEANMDAKHKLNSALGSWTLHTMLEAGFVKENPEVKNSAIANAYMGLRDDSDMPKVIQELSPKGSITTVSAVNFKELTSAASVQYDLTNKLFDSGFDRTFPSFEKPEAATNKVVGSSQKPTYRQRKILEAEQKRPAKLNESVVNSFFGFSSDLQKAMLGFVENVDGVIEAKLGAVKGKNRSIEKDLKTANEFITQVQTQPEGINTPFYYMHTIWAQGRMGIANAFNPQASKIHRYLQHKASWLREDVKIGSKSDNFFMLAVGEGFDIVSDKQSDKDSLADVREKLKEPVIANGIAAMVKIIEGDNSEANQQAVADAVVAGEMGMKTFQVINAYAHREIAKREKTTYSHSLAREVDGVTNGVFIAKLQFANANLKAMFNVLNRMGAFRSLKTFVKFNQEGNQDSYKTLAKDWHKAIVEFIDANAEEFPKLREQFLATQAIFGELAKEGSDGDLEVTGDGRKLAKHPLMTFLYGASQKTILKGMSDNGIAKLYDTLQKAFTNDDLAMANEVLEKFNAVAGTNHKFNSTQAIKNFVFPQPDINKFNRTVSNVYKTGLDKALRVDFSDVIEARTQMNAMINTSATVFLTMYKKRVEEVLKDKPEGPNGLEKFITNAEYKQILEELKPFMPVVNTATSKILKNGKRPDETDYDAELRAILTSGLNLVTPDTEVAQEGRDTAINRVEIKPKTGSTKRTQNLSNTFTDPGASGTPLLTTSIDGLTQLFQMMVMDGLNVHDAEYMGEANFEANKQAYNKNHLGIHERYDMYGETVKMFERVMSTLEHDKDLHNEVMLSDNYLKLSQAFDPDGVDSLSLQEPEKILESARNTAVSYQKNKMAAIDAIVSFEQYTNGTGSAYVPKKNVEAKSLDELIKEIGSTTAPQLQDNFELNDAENTVGELNTLEMYEALGQGETVSVGHDAQLKTVLTKVIDKVIRPLDVKFNNTVSADVDTYIASLMGKPIAPSKLSAFADMTKSERFVRDLVHAVTYEGLSKNTFARGEIVKLHNQAKRIIKPIHFMPLGLNKKDSSYNEEYKIAKAKWDAIFLEQKGTDGKVNYLSEFITAGLTNEVVRAELAKVPYKQIRRTDGKTFLDQLINTWGKIVDTLNAWLNSNTGKTGEAQLDNLVLALANIDSRNKATIRRNVNRLAFPAIQTAKGISLAAEQLSPLKDIAAESLSPMVETTAKLGKQYGSVLREQLLNSENALAKVLADTITEGRGRTETNAKQHNVKRKGNKVIDQGRENVRINVANEMRSKFTTEITEDLEQSLFFGLGKTDLATVRDRLGAGKTVQVIKDELYRKTLISRAMADLKQYKEANFYITQSLNLGNYMATGINRLDQGLRNTRAIADLVGYGIKPEESEVIAKKVALLASLTALDSLNQKDKDNLASLVDTDYAGVMFSLDMLADFKQETMKEFKDNPYNIINGFMHDNLDPDVAIKVGTLADEAKMNKLGYIRVGDALVKDASDPSDVRRYIYKNPHGNPAPYLAGTMYMETKAAKGTSVTKIALESMLSETTSTEISDEVLQAKAFAARNQYTGSLNMQAPHKPVAMLNTEGEITDYNYVMTEVGKDKILGRKPSFFNAVGTMQGDLVAKKVIPEQNQQVVDALYAQYKEDFAQNSSIYVEIRRDSADARVRDIYRMMPKTARAYSKKLFKGNMYVRKDQLDLVFGYRKVRLVDSFYKDPEARKALEHAVVFTLSKVLGSAKAAKAVFYAQDAIEEMVKYTKDVIVIKSGVVTLANTVSNVFQLWLSNVPMSYVAKHYIGSYEALRKYRKFDEERSKIELQLKGSRLSSHQRTQLETKLIRLEDELANNPVGVLLEEGVLPNIVEDISVRPEDFSLRNKALNSAIGTNVLNKTIGKLPPTVQRIGQEVLAMHGSTAYTLLNNAAQFSDFGARAVRFKYLTEEKDMSIDDAIGQVMDEFINYDLPSNRYVQFLNDIGIFWFTKYLVRVQKVILNMFKENPARMLMLLFANNTLGLGAPNPTEAFMGDIMARTSNPFTAMMDSGTDIYSAKLAGTFL